VSTENEFSNGVLLTLPVVLEFRSFQAYGKLPYGYGTSTTEMANGR
jgi:hypothetical protein